MTIQILNYEFLGPIKLSEWGPPMEEVVYLILSRSKDTFNLLYVAQSEKTQARDFFTKNDKLKCWLKHAISENNLYLSIYPMFNSDKNEREKIVNKIMYRYHPSCNKEE